jgi:hypothetical protein
MLRVGWFGAVLAAAGIGAASALLPLRPRVKSGLTLTSAGLVAVSFALWCAWL